MNNSIVDANHDAKPGDYGGRRALLPLVLMSVVFIIVTAYSLARYQETFQHPLRSTAYSNPWIRAAGSPSQAAYFRKNFEISGNVRHAWIKIAAADSFEVNVNRNPLGRQYLWRPTRPFQSGSSERGQVLSWREPAMALNFPRDYQWNGHDNWRLATYIELTSSLRPGRNVIAIESESRSQYAAVTFEGEIQLWSGEIIPLRSDETWYAEPAPPGPQLFDWTETRYWDSEWRGAVACEGPALRGLRSCPEAIYREPFRGEWIRHNSVPGDVPVNFSVDWSLDAPIDEAWLRLIANRSYELYINDRRVRVASVKPPDIDNGNWVFGRGSSHDPTTRPELLDPDEVGTTFVGDQFESPRKADAQLETFIDPFAPQNTPFSYIRTTNRAQEPGVVQPKRSMAESRRTPATPDLFPERPQPNALKHDLSTGGYLAYSIGRLLQPGPNRIEVRCLGKPDANWPAQVALDGGALDHSGRRIDFPAPRDWKARESHRPDSSKEPVAVVGGAYTMDEHFPAVQYRGVAVNSRTFARLFPEALLQIGLLTALTVPLILIAARLFGRQGPFRASRHTDDPETEHSTSLPSWVAAAQTLYAIMLTSTVTLGSAILLETSMVERHEYLWWMEGTAWQIAFALALVASSCVGVVDRYGRIALPGLRQKTQAVSRRLRDLPQSVLWPHLLIWVLLLGAFLRAYKLDLQPLDDDEYASTQAVLSIIDTGAPGFVARDVYYTRSPLFHYLTALLALPFGGDLWSMRLQTVGFGVGTQWLAYRCGVHLLRSRWVGFVSMLLIGVHPLEVFTGHVIRFYQMQQFFALLTVYCFCQGFITSKPSSSGSIEYVPDDSLNEEAAMRKSQRWRIATIFVFLSAVLSQEISIAIAPSLVIGYMLFAKDLGWIRNLELAIYSAIAVAIIGMDFLAFHTLCLTRTEGVSPSIEAAVKLHFWYPLNFLSVFIGYSRLHVVPSFFLFCGIPFLKREGNRNTLALLTFLMSGVLMTNLLVTSVSLRYLYWLFPIWILLSVEGLRLLMTSLVAVVYSPAHNINRYIATSGVCCMICVGCILASWSLWRIPASYELRILGDSTNAVRWVRSQKRPGDKLAITEPHTHCAFLEGDKCDYDIAIPLQYDFAVMRDGVLIDRNGGGELISSLDDLITAFNQGERVWVVINREKLRTRGKNLRWEYPGARFESFLRQNCELKYRTYLWSVFLWDPARGHYRPFQLQE